MSVRRSEHFWTSECAEHTKVALKKRGVIMKKNIMVEGQPVEKVGRGATHRLWLDLSKHSKLSIWNRDYVGGTSFAKDWSNEPSEGI